jgi:predicted transport protein
MDKQLQSMIDNMPEKTGKSLQEWTSILSKQSFSKHSEAVNYLKKEHGVTHGFANTIVHLMKNDNSGEEDLVSRQFEGKENLKPIYDKLTEHINKLGNDVEFAPKKAYVSVRRNKQFAIIQPSTKSRLDLGLNLKGKDPSGKLEASGSWNAMVSHRVRLENPSDVTEQIIEWIREAYDNS